MSRVKAGKPRRSRLEAAVDSADALTAGMDGLAVQWMAFDPHGVRFQAIPPALAAAEQTPDST